MYEGRALPTGHECFTQTTKLVKVAAVLLSTRSLIYRHPLRLFKVHFVTFRGLSKQG